MRQQDLRGLLGPLRVDIVVLEQFVKVRAIPLGQQGGPCAVPRFPGHLESQRGVVVLRVPRSQGALGRFWRETTPAQTR